jgi:hypothetical protein
MMEKLSPKFLYQVGVLRYVPSEWPRLATFGKRLILECSCGKRYFEELCSYCGTSEEVKCYKCDKKLPTNFICMRAGENGESEHFCSEECVLQVHKEEEDAPSNEIGEAYYAYYRRVKEC